MKYGMRNGAIFLAIAVLGGCGTMGPAPMTSEEFRESVKRDGRNIQELTVDRAFDDVVYTFKKMTLQCLSFLPSPDARAGGATAEQAEAWAEGRASVRVSGSNLELSIQRRMRNPEDRMPKDGYYLLVADAHPAGPGKTKVEVYHWESVKEAADVISGWASGERFVCPEKSRLF